MNAAELRTMWAGWNGSASSFRGELARRNIPYLSWSRVGTIERCAACYYRRYVLKLHEEPTEAQRIGILFHQLAERLYRPSKDTVLQLLDSQDFHSLSEKGKCALRNSHRLLVEQMWSGDQVIAVEEPLFLDLAPSLPPVFGIPDLLVREESGSILVVDHKTIQKFEERGAGQLSLYAEMVRRQYGADCVEGCFDEYRRVTDLASVRIPAFRRVRVPTPPELFAVTIASWRDAWHKMRRLEDARDVHSSDGCWGCIRYHQRNPAPHYGSGGLGRASAESVVFRARAADEGEMVLLALALDETRTRDLLARGFRTVADVIEAATADVVMVRDGRRMLKRERVRLRKHLEKARTRWNETCAPRITMPADFHAQAISSLRVQARYVRALQAFGCETLGDLHGLTREDLFRVRGIGHGSFDTLIEELERVIQGRATLS